MWKTSSLVLDLWKQQEAASRVERRHREDDILTTLDESASAKWTRSWSGIVSHSFESCHSHRLFLVLLLRRLRLPLPPVSRSCRCDRLLDSFGHHRAACSRAGVLGRQGFAVESVGSRIFREAGARVATNVLLRDLDLLLPNVHDGRRLEIVAEGLPLFGGVQLVVDTTLVAPLRSDGSPRPNVPSEMVWALQAARRRKERTYPELVGPRARARLVVWAGEVGGRWSGETLACLRLLAEAKSRL